VTSTLALGGDYDPAHLGGLPVRVAHRHLRLAVGAEPVHLPRAPSGGELPGDRVRQDDRQRHQGGCLAGGVADHEALVARALAFAVADAAGNFPGLAGEELANLDALCVEGVFRAQVAHVADRVAHHAVDRDVGLRGDLAGEEDETVLDQDLDRDAGRGVGGEVSVQDAVHDEVGDLVGVALGHRFGGEQVGAMVGAGRVLGATDRGWDTVGTSTKKAPTERRGALTAT
jgi:hypothetical protein